MTRAVVFISVFTIILDVLHAGQVRINFVKYIFGYFHRMCADGIVLGTLSRKSIERVR